MVEPSELNLWTRQWRDERIRKARADHRERAAAYDYLKDKSTDYALSIRMARDVCAQVLAVWETSPVDLPSPKGEAGEMEAGKEDELCTGNRASCLNPMCDAQACLATPLPTHPQQEKP